MKKTRIIYWVFTGLLAALMLMSAIQSIFNVPEAVVLFKHLGYPVYLIPFLGVAKFLGAVAIVVPGFPRIKEWAYAGFVFDITGALYSSISVGDPVTSWVFLIIVYLIILGSYFFYHKKRKLSRDTSLENKQQDTITRTPALQ